MAPPHILAGVRSTPYDLGYTNLTSVYRSDEAF